MEFQLDRARCGGCKTNKRVPREFPPFRFCPYCGRELGPKFDKKKDEVTDMERMTWTEEMDRRAVGLLKEGKNYDEICAEMGLRRSQLQNRLNRLRAQDPTVPFAPRGAAAEQEEPLEGEEGTGQLNELETAMSEVITELRGEVDSLRGENLALSGKCEKLEQSLTEERAKRLEGEIAAKKLKDELDRQSRLLDQMEAELVGERESSDKLRAVIKDLRKGGAELQPQANHDLIVEELEAANRRMNRLVLGLVERYVLGEIANSVEKGGSL